MTAMSAHSLRKVGHKGADLIEPGNTRASFDAALAHGVDMIELDVLPERGGGRLLLAHDYEDAAERAPLTLDQGLAHLASAPFEAIELIVDLKVPGYELRGARGAQAPRTRATRAGLVACTRRASPACGRGPGGCGSAGRCPARGATTCARPSSPCPRWRRCALMRLALPRRARAALERRLCDALSPIGGSCRRGSSPQSSGTAESSTRGPSTRPRASEALEALGVTGVITNDPRLFRDASRHFRRK